MPKAGILLRIFSGIIDFIVDCPTSRPMSGGGLKRNIRGSRNYLKKNAKEINGEMGSSGPESDRGHLDIFECTALLRESVEPAARELH